MGGAHKENCGCSYCLPETHERFGKLDHKYAGIVFKATDMATPIPQDEWIVFRAKDNALLDTLAFYLGKCQELGTNTEHIESILELMGRIRTWRANNPTKCKVPDTYLDELMFDALDEKALM